MGVVYDDVASAKRHLELPVRCADGALGAVRCFYRVGQCAISTSADGCRSTYPAAMITSVFFD